MEVKEEPMRLYKFVGQHEDQLVEITAVADGFVAAEVLAARQAINENWDWKKFSLQTSHEIDVPKILEVRRLKNG